MNDDRWNMLMAIALTDPSSLACASVTTAVTADTRSSRGGRIDGLNRAMIGKRVPQVSHAIRCRQC